MRTEKSGQTGEKKRLNYSFLFSCVFRWCDCTLRKPRRLKSAKCWNEERNLIRWVTEWEMHKTQLVFLHCSSQHLKQISRRRDIGLTWRRERGREMERQRDREMERWRERRRDGEMEKRRYILTPRWLVGCWLVGEFGSHFGNQRKKIPWGSCGRIGTGNS